MLDISWGERAAGAKGGDMAGAGRRAGQVLQLPADREEAARCGRAPRRGRPRGLEAKGRVTTSSAVEE